MRDKVKLCGKFLTGDWTVARRWNYDTQKIERRHKNELKLAWVTQPDKDGKFYLGYKACSIRDTGYFYAPYVPTTRTPVVLDPESFNPRVGIMTRYGKKLIKEGAKYYSKVPVSEFAELEGAKHATRNITGRSEQINPCKEISLC